MLTRIFNSLKRFVGSFKCEHEWLFMIRIREQNLRSGHRHYSNVYRCERCFKTKTVEQDR